MAHERFQSRVGATRGTVRDDGFPALGTLALASFFHGLDSARQAAGQWFDLAGLGPVQTPSTMVLDGPGWRLRRYGTDKRQGPLLLIVPAPIKRHYIWDLMPSCSVVRRAAADGCLVYLLEWTQAPSDLGLDAYIQAIDRCAGWLAQSTARRPHLLGHSLGGTLAALHVARSASHSASLVMVESPLSFGRNAGALAPLLAVGPKGAAIQAAFSSVPGTLLGLAAVLASPKEFLWERYADAVATAMAGGALMKKHLLAIRWTLDELPMPGKLLAQLIDQLYLEDRLMRRKLIIGGRRVAPLDVSVPIAAVVDPRSRILPSASMIDFLRAAPRREQLLLQYAGDVGVALQHVGALIGDTAHREIWPRILRWLRQLDKGSSNPQPLPLLPASK